MLQILLAFLAISIISVSGYGLVEQLSLQQIAADQRENMRRLDVAADAIQGKLVTMPGVEGVFAPAPQNLDTGWSYMPKGLGGINANTDGVPFLYCPMSSEAAQTVTMPVKSADGSFYGVDVRSGVVVGSQLRHNVKLNDGITAYRPIAFIIAAGRGKQAPPSCSNVMERNGRPFVEGGLVRLVSVPGDVMGAGTVSAAISDIYVSSAGGGNGRFNDPSTIEDAMRQWIRFRPAVMTIHLTGNVSVQDAGLWTDFIRALGSASSRLIVQGAGYSLSAPAGQMGTPASLTLSNASLFGPTLIVEGGDQVSTIGNVVLTPGEGGSAMYVQQGARLAVNGILRMAGAPDNGVEVAGDVVVSNGTIAASGKSWSIGLLNGSRLSAVNAQIGDPAARNNSAGLMVANVSSVTADSASRVAAANSGLCWQSAASEDWTFLYSGNGPGSRSSVSPDPAPRGSPVSDDPNEVAAYQEYRREVDGHQRARQSNRSSFSCI